MFRIAVIQNGIEMQHSGYVDAVPNYKREFGGEKVVYDRYSGVNIRELFREGINYLLEYDSLIIGTNATSDDDVYTALKDETHKGILALFIERGKGVLICSQKKYDICTTNLSGQATDGVKIASSQESVERISNILPRVYEYKVMPRQEENSAAPSAQPANEITSLIQEYILGCTHKIDKNTIKDICEDNAFQPHYYRDIIVPIFSSSYFPIICDTRSGQPSRNLLMVASPRKKERICISTMALDWAGHWQLLEHIIDYITRGIPTVGFISMKDKVNKDMNLLIEQAELSRIPFEHYNGLEKFKSSNMRKYHSLIIFSPDFAEDVVGEIWDEIKKYETQLLRAYFYKKIGNDFALVKFSNNSFVEPQKNACFAWIASKYNNGLWDNSFWKTYDVLFSMHELRYKNIVNYIPGALKAFVQSKHYKEGSYDGVLAPTCGLFEFLCLVKKYYVEIAKEFDVDNCIEKTKLWLFNKYITTNSYNNKQFIIRSFSGTSRLDELKEFLIEKKLTLESELKEILTKEEVDFEKRYGIDICLTVEICLIVQDECKDKASVAKDRIKKCLDILINIRRQENGKWENLSNSAIVLISLLRNKDKLLEMYDSRDIMQDTFKKAIDSGIYAIRRDYNNKECNWERSIVTTANALKAIVLYDNQAEHHSKDFLNDFMSESNEITSYNSLNLALDTLEKRTERNFSLENELEVSKRDNEHLKSKLKSTLNKFLTMTFIAVVATLLIVSLYVFLYFKDTSEGKAIFSSMISEPMMWIPVAVASALTTFITFLVKKITGGRENANKKHRHKKNRSAKK